MSSQARSRLIFLGATIVAVVVGIVIATSGDDDSTSSSTTAAASRDCVKVDAPPPKDDEFKHPEQVLGRGEPAVATVQTNCGSFSIDLDTENSPKTANSFAFLAEQGFYDGTIFHRIAPGFVIQGGDPTGTGTGGPGYTTRDAPPEGASYPKYTVAMAKGGAEPPGTAGSQFFVMTGDSGLPPDYAIVGKVSDGKKVIDAIGILGDPSEQPTQIVKVEKAAAKQG